MCQINVQKLVSSASKLQQKIKKYFAKIENSIHECQKLWIQLTHTHNWYIYWKPKNVQLHRNNYLNLFVIHHISQNIKLNRFVGSKCRVSDVVKIE